MLPALGPEPTRRGSIHGGVTGHFLHGVLRTVRGEATYDALSTTDRLQEPDGPVLSVLALVEQTRGGSGAYGTTADAAERLPALPETAEVGTEGDGSGGDGTEGGAAPSDGGGAE